MREYVDNGEVFLNHYGDSNDCLSQNKRVVPHVRYVCGDDIYAPAPAQELVPLTNSDYGLDNAAYIGSKWENYLNGGRLEDIQELFGTELSTHMVYLGRVDRENQTVDDAKFTIDQQYKVNPSVANSFGNINTNENIYVDGILLGKYLGYAAISSGDEGYVRLYIQMNNTLWTTGNTQRLHHVADNTLYEGPGKIEIQSTLPAAPDPELDLTTFITNCVDNVEEKKYKTCQNDTNWNDTYKDEDAAAATDAAAIEVVKNCMDSNNIWKDYYCDDSNFTYSKSDTNLSREEKCLMDNKSWNPSTDNRHGNNVGFYCWDSNDSNKDLNYIKTKTECLSLFKNPSGQNEWKYGLGDCEGDTFVRGEDHSDECVRDNKSWEQIGTCERDSNYSNDSNECINHTATWYWDSNEGRCLDDRYVTPEECNTSSYNKPLYDNATSLYCSNPIYTKYSSIKNISCLKDNNIWENKCTDNHYSDKGNCESNNIQHIDCGLYQTITDFKNEGGSYTRVLKECHDHEYYYRMHNVDTNDIDTNMYVRQYKNDEIYTTMTISEIGNNYVQLKSTLSEHFNDTDNPTQLHYLANPVFKDTNEDTLGNDIHNTTSYYRFTIQSDTNTIDSRISQVSKFSTTTTTTSRITAQGNVICQLDSNTLLVVNETPGEEFRWSDTRVDDVWIPLDTDTNLTFEYDTPHTLFSSTITYSDENTLKVTADTNHPGKVLLLDGETLIYSSKTRTNIQDTNSTTISVSIQNVSYEDSNFTTLTGVLARTHDSNDSNINVVLDGKHHNYSKFTIDSKHSDIYIDHTDKYAIVQEEEESAEAKARTEEERHIKDTIFVEKVFDDTLILDEDNSIHTEINSNPVIISYAFQYLQFSDSNEYPEGTAVKYSNEVTVGYIHRSSDSNHTNIIAHGDKITTVNDFAVDGTTLTDGWDSEYYYVLGTETTNVEVGHIVTQEINGIMTIDDAEVVSVDTNHSQIIVKMNSSSDILEKDSDYYLKTKDESPIRTQSYCISRALMKHDEGSLLYKTKTDTLEIGDITAITDNFISISRSDAGSLQNGDVLYVGENRIAIYLNILTNKVYTSTNPLYTFKEGDAVYATDPKSVSGISILGTAKHIYSDRIELFETPLVMLSHKTDIFAVPTISSVSPIFIQNIIQNKSFSAIVQQDCINSNQLLLDFSNVNNVLPSADVMEIIRDNWYKQGLDVVIKSRNPYVFMRTTNITIPMEISVNVNSHIEKMLSGLTLDYRLGFGKTNAKINYEVTDTNNGGDTNYEGLKNNVMDEYMVLMFPVTDSNDTNVNVQEGDILLQSSWTAPSFEYLPGQCVHKSATEKWCVEDEDYNWSEKYLECVDFSKKMEECTGKDFTFMNDKDEIFNMRQQSSVTNHIRDHKSNDIAKYTWQQWNENIVRYPSDVYDSEKVLHMDTNHELYDLFYHDFYDSYHYISNCKSISKYDSNFGSFKFECASSSNNPKGDITIFDKDNVEYGVVNYLSDKYVYMKTPIARVIEKDKPLYIKQKALPDTYQKKIELNGFTVNIKAAGEVDKVFYEEVDSVYYVRVKLLNARYPSQEVKGFESSNSEDNNTVFYCFDANTGDKKALFNTGIANHTDIQHWLFKEDSDTNTPFAKIIRNDNYDPSTDPYFITTLYDEKHVSARSKVLVKMDKLAQWNNGPCSHEAFTTEKECINPNIEKGFELDQLHSRATISTNPSLIVDPNAQNHLLHIYRCEMSLLTNVSVGDKMYSTEDTNIVGDVIYTNIFDESYAYVSFSFDEFEVEHENITSNIHSLYIAKEKEYLAEISYQTDFLTQDNRVMRAIQFRAKLFNAKCKKNDVEIGRISELYIHSYMIRLVGGTSLINPYNPKSGGAYITIINNNTKEVLWKEIVTVFTNDNVVELHYLSMDDLGIFMIQALKSPNTTLLIEQDKEQITEVGNEETFIRYVTADTNMDTFINMQVTITKTDEDSQVIDTNTTLESSTHEWDSNSSTCKDIETYVQLDDYKDSNECVGPFNLSVVDLGNVTDCTLLQNVYEMEINHEESLVLPGKTKVLESGTNVHILATKRSEHIESFVVKRVDTFANYLNYKTGAFKHNPVFCTEPLLPNTKITTDISTIEFSGLLTNSSVEITGLHNMIKLPGTANILMNGDEDAEFALIVKDKSSTEKNTRDTQHEWGSYRTVLYDDFDTTGMNVGNRLKLGY